MYNRFMTIGKKTIYCALELWKRGIELAMIAHFCTDIMILIVIPTLLLN